MKTRYSGGQEIWPTPSDEELYGLAMRKIVSETGPPPPLRNDEIFDEQGDLRRDVFEVAFSQLNPTSTPGFPFQEVPSNSELDPQAVYEEVNRMIKIWSDIPSHAHLVSAYWHFRNDIKYQDRNSDSDEEEVMTRTELLLDGLAPPSTMFVKGEGTDKKKVARLIFGVSVINNVIARILFGHWLKALPESWDVWSHKVGFDFTSTSGLTRYSLFYRRLYDNVVAAGDRLECDDIQGWDFMARLWMHDAFHEQMRIKSRAMVEPFDDEFDKFFHIWRSYQAAEAMATVVDSDGYIHELPFYIQFSGAVLTHIQNSLERAALGLCDYVYSKAQDYGYEPDTRVRRLVSSTNAFYETALNILASLPTCVETNGDDFVGISTGRAPFSERYGWVHTDRAQATLERHCFCSQVFTPGPGGLLQRRPESLVKATFNLLDQEPETVAFYDTLLYMADHPSAQRVLTLVLALHAQDV